MNEKIIKKIIFLAAMFLFIGCVIALQYWYIFVTSTEKLNDPYGNKINAFMPVALQDWGCKKLKIRFSSFPPPPSCTTNSGLEWRK